MQKMLLESFVAGIGAGLGAALAGYIMMSLFPGLLGMNAWYEIALGQFAIAGGGTFLGVLAGSYFTTSSRY